MIWGVREKPSGVSAAHAAPSQPAARRAQLLMPILGAAILLVVATSAVQIIAVVNAWLVEGDDFTQYWNGARAVAAGQNPYEWAVANRPLEVSDYHYPPLLALLLAPATLVFDYATARWAWLAFSALCVAVGTTLAWRTSGIRWRDPRGLAALAFLGLLPATFIALEMGQLSPQLLLVIAASYAALNQRPGRAGALLAVATYLKSFPGLLVGDFLLRRQWRGCVAAVGTGLALAALSVAVLGWEPHWTYITRVIPSQGRWFGGPFNVSLNGFFTHLLIDTPFSSPIIDAQTVGLVSIILSTALLLAATFYAVARAPANAQGDRLAFAVTATAMMLAAPINGQYNLVLAVVPLALVVARVQEAWPNGLRWLLLVWILLSLPVEFCDFGLFAQWCGPDLSNVPVKDLPWRQGWGNLLTSGRFFGLLLLWALLLRFCLERDPDRCAGQQSSRQERPWRQ
jgi:Glycosyltransferase family 87